MDTLPVLVPRILEYLTQTRDLKNFVIEILESFNVEIPRIK